MERKSRIFRCAVIAYDTGFHYVLPKIGSGGVADVNVMTEAATIAGRFLFARRNAAGLADYPGDFPASLDEAYQVQDAAIAAWGRPVIGWKVGRINAPLDQSLGADRLAGPIFASKIVAADGGGAVDGAERLGGTIDLRPPAH